MAEIRRAQESDLGEIREIFLASYGATYAYPQYYDAGALKKMLFSDDTLLLVAVDESTKRIAGTASVLLQVGAYADLVGEFGRLAVHPDFRGRGVGKQLMQGRIERVQERLHLGLVEPRTKHPYSQKIALKHGFAPIGFLPMNLLFDRRESALTCARYFGDSLQLRKNHPQIIPEAYALAALAQENCGIDTDLIVDGDAAPYPIEEDFELEEMSAEGYAALLRIQRGRIRHREIFGPMRLHYGLFKLRSRHSTYLLARHQGRIVGAVGCVVDELEKAVRIFELIVLSDAPIHFLLAKLLERCREQWRAEYVEVDVSAYAPRMQRTLLELGFLPSAYVPAMVFHDVERLDALKMSQLLVPPDFSDVTAIESTRPIIELVMREFLNAAVLPQVVQNVGKIALLADLNEEQGRQLASLCELRSFDRGDVIVAEGQMGDAVHLVLKGQVGVTSAQSTGQLATLVVGDCVGERALLRHRPHSATATALDNVETAIIPHQPLNGLIRRRPDIGVILYRNLARGLCEKLKISDERIAAADASSGAAPVTDSC